MLYALVTSSSLYLLALGAPMSEAPEATTAGSHGISTRASLDRRQIEVPIINELVTFVTVTEWTSTQVTTAVTEVVTVDASPTDMPFLVVPPFDSLPTSTSAGEETAVSTTTETVIMPETVTSTFTEPPETVTVTVPPSTVTRTVTVPEPSSPTASTYWVSPSHYSDLDSFKIKNFATGQDNLEIVDEVPKWAGGSKHNDEQHSILQIFYPEDSINPGNADAPIGGSGFYATPLSLSEATNVTLEYSVFFPLGFDWVLGGKLPGLYGGHMSCSGGDDAKMCFSTRMMWRSQGAGELYLYAPKDKQTESLCRAPPESHCNEEYGLSIGRGSFYFIPGSWTRIRQTVRLNFPGEQNGGFELEVNGRHIMRRDDVFYRDVPGASTTPTATSAVPAETSARLLGPILGGIFDVVGNWRVTPELQPVGEAFLIGESLLVARPAWMQPINESVISPDYPATPTTAPDISQSVSDEPTRTIQVTSTTTHTVSTTVTTSVAEETPSSSLSNFRILSSSVRPIGFSGLFFSTFFGGNSEEYASPEDQFTWFKDFSITINE